MPALNTPGIATQPFAINWRNRCEGDFIIGG
jgi:hypothetical protein